MGKRVLTSSLFDGEKDVYAFFTTRDLPLKPGERENLTTEVENNKKLICKGFNIPEENLIIPVQTHSTNVGIIQAPFSSQIFENTDALITEEKNIAIALNFADCVPIIFYDPIKKISAIAHAGWRGTASKIAVKTVKKMVKKFNCKPKDIIALIGASIGRCCFEVKEDVKEKLLQTVGESQKSLVYDNMHIDLKLINKLQIQSCGVVKIDVSEDCTCCKNGLYFSYRKEKGNTARHSAVIIMKNCI